MSEQDKLSRREFFGRAALLGAAVSSTGAFLSACDSGGGSDSSTAKSGQSGKSGSKGDTLNCNPDDLPDSQKQTRKALKYVDKSPKPDKLCKNCSLYEKPEEPGTCGGCTSVPGPIHPQGYCTAYQPAKG